MRADNTTPVDPQVADGNSVLQTLLAKVVSLDGKLDEIEKLLRGQPTKKEWFSVGEAADVLGKAPFTVREWCRLGRVNAHKRPCGRGRTQEWNLSRAEIVRIQNQGLLPQDL